MEKLTIFLDEDLKHQMSLHDVDWSNICIKAIKTEINILQNHKPNLDDLLDIDLEVHEYNIPQNQVYELDMDFYDTFRKVWKEFYDIGYSGGSFNYANGKPPTSKQMKKLWKLWYEPNFNQGEWFEKYEARQWHSDSSYEKTLSENGLDQWRLFQRFAEEWGEDLDNTAFGEFVCNFVFEGEFVDITDVNPFKCNYMLFEEKDELPDSSGIYFVIDESNIYYIGMSKNIRNRWYSHHKEEELEKYPNLKIAYTKFKKYCYNTDTSNYCK